MTEALRILLVEDDPALAREIVRALEREHWALDRSCSRRKIASIPAVHNFSHRA